MSSSSQLKKEFLKKWAKGLQTYTSSRKEMSFLERKKAIKLSADVAMASTRIITTTSWSFALIWNVIKNDYSSAGLVKNILGPESWEKVIKKRSSDLSMSVCHKRFRSKNILKRSCRINAERARKAKAPRAILATCIARRMVKKRTQVLKKLVPGGDSMDEFSLIKETLDYIVSLRAQVDVMRCLATAAGSLSCKNMDDI